jgi:hypothetical protein
MQGYERETPTDESPSNRRGVVKPAAILSGLLGLGFGLPCLCGIRHFSATGEVWTFLGFPTYGGGPFERLGIPTTVPLLAAFQVVCAAEVVTGWLLWRRKRAGVVLSVALLPVELAFWSGFALPFGPPLGLVRTIAVITNSSSFAQVRR